MRCQRYTSDQPVKVFAKKKAELTIKGDHIRIDGQCEVPVFAAIFLIGRKMATMQGTKEST